MLRMNSTGNIDITGENLDLMDLVGEEESYPIISKHFGKYGHKVQCHDNIKTTKKEEVASHILYWSRHLNMGHKVCQEYGIYPGPRGVIDKKRRWWPAPLESCDCLKYKAHTYITSQRTLKSGEVKEYQRPDLYSIWHHCRSLQHCRYLVKYRLHHVYECVSAMDSLIDMVEQEAYPLFIRESAGFSYRLDDLHRRFATDALKGNNFDISVFSSIKENTCQE
jgi:hypothetical protein